MKSLCVFCGSSSGLEPSFNQMAKDLGLFLAQNEIQLVYGGASIGLMGALADTVLENGGKVIGVIPEDLQKRELAHDGLTQLHIVDSMHSRKFKMYEFSDAFMAIPGGMGTLDELCEIVTWAQLDIHNKPCYLYSFNGFFNYYWKQLNFMHEKGFLSREHLALVRYRENYQELCKELISL